MPVAIRMALTMLDTELTGRFSPRGPTGMVLLLRLTRILAFTLGSGQARLKSQTDAVPRCQVVMTAEAGIKYAADYPMYDQPLRHPDQTRYARIRPLWCGTERHPDDAHPAQ